MSTEGLVLNKELLAKVRSEILREPAMFSMAFWKFDIEQYMLEPGFGKGKRWRQEQIREKNLCGTVCCIAGHAVRLAAPEWFKLLPQSALRSEPWIAKGASVLGLSLEDAETLFMPFHWPEPWKQEHIDALGDPMVEAKIAASLIGAVIESEGAILEQGSVSQGSPISDYFI